VIETPDGGLEASSLLSRYVPPAVLRRLESGLAELPHVERFDGAVLVTDISGFTRMTEGIALQGPEPVETLQDLINAYFDRLITCVDEHGGEVVSFTGDGLIATWPERTPDGLGDVLQRAARCGSQLAQLASSHPDGVDLSIRVGISAGRLRLLELGGVHGRRLSLLLGEPIAAASAASDAVARGELGVDAAAWALLSGRASGEALTDGIVRLSTVQPAPSLSTKVQPPRRAVELMAPYVPPAVLMHAGVDDGTWLSEFRFVTVVFVGLPDLSDQAELADGQATIRLLQEEFDRHEVTLLELAVDAKGTSVLAATGLPLLSHDDDAVRAVRAGMSIAAALGARGASGGVGVASGRAFCGPIGNQLRSQYALVGDVVNTAARLAGRALLESPTPPQVLCDSPTMHAARGRLEWGASREVELKGKRAPVTVFAPRRLRSEFSLSDETVGRGQERTRIADAQRAAFEGAVRVVVIEAEAGMGKSRLVHETLASVAAGGVRCVAGTGDPIERAAPYHAWRSVIAALLGLDEGIDPATRAAQATAALPADARGLAPLLNLVLGLELPETEDSVKLQGERRTQVMRRLLLRLVEEAASEPLLIALDDAHWLDSASWALILELVGRAVPILAIVATRPGAGLAPEFQELLREQATTLIALEPLATSDMLAIACRCLNVSEVPDAVADLVAAKATGNPLFTQELVYSLRDSGVVEVLADRCIVKVGRDLATVALPDSVDGIIGSRIDRLEPQPDLALKIASTVGLTFAAEIIQDLYPAPATAGLVDRSLDTLVRRDLTVRVPSPTGVAYAFRHPLTREVAYHRMPFRQRRELHRLVAEWFESRYPDNPEPVLTTLAHHWSSAGVVDKAIQYLSLASEQTFTNGMSREAANLGLRAAELLGEPLPRDPEAIGAAIAETIAAIGERMAGIEVEQIAALPRATDPAQAAVIATLLAVAPSVFVSGQVELFALVGLRAFLLTLDHGATPYTPAALAIYAMIVRSIDDDPATAFALSELAERLAERDSPPLRAYAGFVHHFFVRHWLEPLGPDLERVLENAASGFEHGDWMFGCFNLACHVIQLAASGAPLAQVELAGTSADGVIAGRSIQAGFHAVHQTQLAKALDGRTTDRCSFTDRPDLGTVEEERDLASILRTDLHEEIGYYLASKLRLHFLYREYRRAVAYGSRAEQSLFGISGQVEEVEFTFTFALALYARYEHTGDEALLTRARALRDRVRGWQTHAPAIFGHKAIALDAADARATGDLALAARGFVEAADAAQELGYIQHVALAHELGGRALLEAGDPAGARELLARSRTGYQAWGASAKVADLDDALAEL
jgi:predicted ATPase/class 3 adenylate cyclase